MPMNTPRPLHPPGLPRWLACLALAWAATAHAAADDIARLYALPPAGSISLRVVNPSANAASVQWGNGAAVTLASTGTIASEYRAFPAGQTPALRIDGQTVDIDWPALGTHAGGFVTLVLTGSGAKPAVAPLADSAATLDGLKAELIFYNLAAGCTARVLIENGPDVFAGAVPLSRSTRAINPVSANLEGECGDVRSGPLPLPELGPGDRYSLFLVGSAGQPRLAGALNRTEPYRKP
jgi:alginate O-acetyltransferase complex protein AlgF